MSSIIARQLTALALVLCLSSSCAAEPPRRRRHHHSSPALPLREWQRSSTTLVAAPELHTVKLSPAPSFDFVLVYYFFGWALGSYIFTVSNKLALKAAGGARGFPVTIGLVQMLFGSCYALYLWAAPDARALPRTTFSDMLKIAPVAACHAAAHMAYILSMNLGAASFAHIVKAAEPVCPAPHGLNPQSLHATPLTDQRDRIS